jgi:N6-L-threonylcarbamoyladenine synthase
MDDCCNLISKEKLDIPVSINGCYMSFSGPESHVQRYLQNQQNNEALSAAVSKGVFMCIAKSLEKTLLNASKEYSAKDVLIVGGVASNKYIRDYLTNNNKLKSDNMRLFFCEPRYSTDNALGTALIGLDKG